MECMTSFRWRALIVGLVVFVFLVPAALFFFAVGFSSFKNVGGGPFREDACVVLHRENYAKVCSTAWIGSPLVPLFTARGGKATCAAPSD